MLTPASRVSTMTVARMVPVETKKKTKMNYYCRIIIITIFYELFLNKEWLYLSENIKTNY